MLELEELRGLSLGGVYTLENVLGHDDAGSFLTVLTADGQRLLTKLVPQQDPEAERRFATWGRSRHLRHPHLLHIRDAGHAQLSGANYIYAIFEYPDDFLASALQQGPLSEPETLDVVKAAVAALRYLHGQGLVHGAVDADHIVAVGEHVKLSTDSLRESDDLEGQSEDVRQLGELVRILRAPEPLGEPLATILLHATVPDARSRWTLAEIANLIDPPPPANPAIPEMPAAVPPVRYSEAEARSPGPFPKWIVAALALLLLFILIFNLRRHRDAAPVISERPATPLASGPVKVKLPQPALGKWRVIAFTYRSRESAEKKVKQINTRWPGFHASVFAPRSIHGYFLVTLGSGMNREEAARLQNKARTLGMSRDIYVQNYSE